MGIKSLLFISKVVKLMATVYEAQNLHVVVVVIHNICSKHTSQQTFSMFMLQIHAQIYVGLHPKRSLFAL